MGMLQDEPALVSFALRVFISLLQEETWGKVSVEQSLASQMGF